MLKAIKNALRQLGYRVRFGGRDIAIGPRTRISGRATLRLHGGGRIKVGRDCRISDYAMIMSYGGSVEIGDDCSVNPFCLLYGHGGLKIGNGVRIASHTILIPANHTFDDPDVPISRQPETRLGIEVGDDVWLATGCKILDGVKIGRGCVVGAGAVVTKSLPEYSIAVGVPARIVGNRKIRAAG
jgi:acetyltransferase-like isoleucine patch superfamily enzyme